MIPVTTTICVFCLDLHDPVKCTAYSTVTTRQNRLNALRLCYRCFTPGHIPTKCVEKVCCDICGKGSHHTALCCKNPLTKDSDVVPQKKEWCVFCNKHLNSTDCHVVKTFLKRLKHIDAMNLCITCLTQHPNVPCPVMMAACEYCEETGHHKAVCRGNPFLEENAKTDPTKGECMFCFTHKKPSECAIVIRLQDRLYILAQQGRCQKCLHEHPTEKCYYRYRCQLCRSSEHNYVICPLDPRLDRNSAPSMPPSSPVPGPFSMPSLCPMPSPLSSPMPSSSPKPSFTSEGDVNSLSSVFTTSSSTMNDTFSEHSFASFASEDSAYSYTASPSPPSADDRWAKPHVAALLRGCGIEEDPEDLDHLKSHVYDPSPMITHNSTKSFVTSYMSNYPTWYAPGFDPNDQTNYQGLNSFYPEYLKDIELDDIDRKVHALLWSDKPIIETLRKLK